MPMSKHLIVNISPLDQFEIRDLISLDAPIIGNMHISITNIGFYLTIGGFLAFFFNILASNNIRRIVANN
jgi:F-type H+-transporting ATPase subunit a